MRYRYHTLDVFTDQIFGGNPLAVFPEATGLDEERMQRIARELNLSETVFVLPPHSEDATCRIRIFTPARELPFAGHPTVGTAILLAALGRVRAEGSEARVVLEEGVGPVSVTVRLRDGVPVFAQLSAARPPEVGPAPPPLAEIAAMLSVSPEDLAGGGQEPAMVSCGVPFLIVPLRDREALGRARLDLSRWERVLADAWANSVYLISPGEESDIRARMFGPGVGIVEDPATGAAASALAGYLAMRDPSTDGILRWTVEQGIEMGRPSWLELEAEKQGGAVTVVRVGGAAVLVGEGEMLVPPPIL